MRHRIRVVPEVEARPDEPRESDPGAAEPADGAVDASRPAGPGLGDWPRAWYAGLIPRGHVRRERYPAGPG